MEWISNLFDNIKYWFSCLSGVFKILIFGLTLFIISECATGYFGRTYQKYRQNNKSYTLALKEFKRVCKGYKVWESNDYESEYYKLYDNRNEAINDFMRLAETFDAIYANGKFRHIYILGNERVYRCCDKDKNRIAIRVKKNKRIGLNWKPNYEINFFIEY
jgi:hypothetical protein